MSGSRGARKAKRLWGRWDAAMTKLAKLREAEADAGVIKHQVKIAVQRERIAVRWAGIGLPPTSSY